MPIANEDLLRLLAKGLCHWLLPGQRPRGPPPGRQQGVALGNLLYFLPLTAWTETHLVTFHALVDDITVLKR